MADVASKLSKLNPFSKRKDDGDDKGEQIQPDSIVGGHSSRDSDHKAKLRVSHALKSYLVHREALSEADAGEGPESTPALQALLSRHHVAVPPELLDRSHPLPEYFISSSHNTYLQAHQLYGSSSASAYETALKTGSRCVEIDAWDNDDDVNEPKVTHGFTLVSHIPFRAVCETIRDGLDQEIATAAANPAFSPAPIIISLENHCDAPGQLRLAQIMREVFGPRLLSEAVRREGHEEQSGGDHVSLADLGARIAVIVEYHIPGEVKDSDSDSSDSSDDEDEKAARKDYKDKKKTAVSSVIVPELAALGVYAQSVKPGDNSWYDPGELSNGPHHHLINVSESGLSSHMPEKSELIARHNSKHLMRVFPKGTRISSSNLKPVAYWGVGAQICALNWQSFGTSNQLNAALFDGSDGYVLKPKALRAGGSGKLTTGQRKKLRVHIGGATDLPLHEDTEADSVKPYVTCSLFHPSDLENEPVKRKTAAYKHHKLGFLHRGENPPPTDPVWDETLEWDYEDSDLTFLRILIKSDDSFSRNPIFAVAAVRLAYVVPGWTFIRMLDLKGRETKCTLLVKIETANDDATAWSPSAIVKPGGMAGMVQVQ